VSAWSRANEPAISSWESDYTKTCTAEATTTAACTDVASAGGSATGAAASATGSKGAAAPQNTMMAVAAGALAGAVGLIAAL
jgi:hypothetical protein